MAVGEEEERRCSFQRPLDCGEWEPGLEPNPTPTEYVGESDKERPES